MSEISEQAILEKYLPKESVPPILRILKEYKVQFRIVGKRRTKLGDYTFHQNRIHKITINHHLNPYYFLFVTLHELAHLKVHVRYPRKQLQPHGLEWKREFQQLFAPFLSLDIFPHELNVLIQIHLQDPSASSSTDHILLKEFTKYDEPTEKEAAAKGRSLDELEPQTLFRLGEHTYRIMEKRRKHFKCLRISDNKVYIVHALAEVEIV